MRSLPLALALLAGPALAAPLGEAASVEAPLVDEVDTVVHPEGVEVPVPEAVVGGRPAAAGSWPDAAGIVFNGQYVGCTGTLVAPDVVLTAGHCVGDITHVMLDATNWFASDEAEVIPVVSQTAHPGGYDIAVLKLARKATTPYRVIARDCVIEENLDVGSKVVIVGYGVTQENGRGFNSNLNQGATQVQTPACEETFVDGIFTGCNTRLPPGGEIGAGGDGVDACFGDSGGPLYLPTDSGTFLIGVTSRAYAGVPESAPCAYGGIYTRPDAVIGWIERVSDTPMPYPDTCNEAPTVQAEPIDVAAGATRDVVLDVVDPDGEAFRVKVIEPPAHGSVNVADDGSVTYTADADFSGADAFTLEVIDDGSERWPDAPVKRVQISIPVEVVACGCATGAQPSVAWVLGLAAVGLRRRRRA